MSKIECKTPNVKIIEYKQDDKSRIENGCCVWARFTLDLDNYSMHIDSDCGSYGYTWVPTPNYESFLQLCARFDKWYLRDKFSSRSEIDNNETWENIKQLVKDQYLDDDIEEWEKENGIDLYEELENACKSYLEERQIIDAIAFKLIHTPLEYKISDYDIWESLSKDYPINVKTITRIYVKEIIPFIKENLL